MFSAAFYRSSAREVKRHEAVLRSTVFARFGEAIMGTATIRAYGLQDQFSKSVRTAVDDMNSAYYLTFANQRWLSVRLDIVGILLVFTTGVLVVTSRFSVNPSIAGLVLSYILTIVQMIQFTVRQLAEVENNMNSTERIHHYGTELEEEAPLTMGEVRPTWPEHGEIVFDNVEMRYRAGLPLVLKGMSMHVRAGERIGVVGRTGAGKSSIMSTLFRLQELSGGSIVIDGVDISKIGLHDLRSKLAIIPQDPTLFKGTIRSNLDPFHEHSDLELWSALRQADLVSNEATMDDHSGRIHLDSVVEEEGKSTCRTHETQIQTLTCSQVSISRLASANSWYVNPLLRILLKTKAGSGLL
jgi:ATP-binding cassette subfamily C (CFTR/MRP) protein 1